MSDPGADRPAPEHRRPEGVDDTTVEALGKLSEALEVVENARGYLYAFHRLTGMGDLALGDAVELLREAGHDRGPSTSSRVGRNVIEGRWTFQIVEEYDDGYYPLFKELEAEARDRAGRRQAAPVRGRDEGVSAHPRGPTTRRPPSRGADPRPRLLPEEPDQRLVELPGVTGVDAVRAVLDHHQLAALDGVVGASPEPSKGTITSASPWITSVGTLTTRRRSGSRCSTRRCSRSAASGRTAGDRQRLLRFSSTTVRSP